MNEPGITPHTSLDCELRWLRQQRLDHIAELELAADLIAAKDVRIAQLEADQTSLILHSRRLEH